jgi:methionyl-tRNA synthetase
LKFKNKNLVLIDLNVLQYGKRVTVLVNLAPRALRGVESQGMILMTNNAEGKLVFVNPDAEGVGNGETIS